MIANYIGRIVEIIISFGILFWIWWSLIGGKDRWRNNIEL